MQPHEIIVGIIAAVVAGAGLGIAIIRAITWLAERNPIKERHYDRNSNHYD